MLNKIFLLILIVVATVTLSFTGVYSVNSAEADSTNLAAGKNHVRFNLTEAFYARDIVKWNPSITVLSYTGGNKTIGYVNLFNGIGDNFIIENNKDYEIILNKNISLVLPPGAGFLKEEV